MIKINKKVIIGIVSILVVISGCLFVMFNSSNKSYEVITNETEERKMNTNALAMMYETASGESRLIDENSSPVNSTEKITIFFLVLVVPIDS